MATNQGNPYSQGDVERSEQITFQARNLTEELKDQLGIRSRLNETDKATLNLAKALQRSAQENTIELGNQGKIGRQIIKDQKQLLKVGNERSALEKTANISLAENILKEQSAAAAAQEELLTASGARATILQSNIANHEQELKKLLLNADADTQRLALAYAMESVYKKLIDQRSKEADIQKDINDKMGVTGAVVKGTGALMERLGMRSGIFNDAMSDSAERMKEMAEEATRVDENGKLIGENFSRTEIALEGMTILMKGFRKGLTDPAVIAAGILNTFLKINKTQTDTTRLIGESAATFRNTLNTELVSLNDVMIQINESTKQLGMNAQAIFSSSTLSAMAEGVNMLGLTSEQATNLGLRADYIGESVDGFTDGILKGADAGNRLAKSAVAPGVALQDILNTSEDISLSLGQNPEALGEAAVAARALGLELDKVDNIASGLMDFESSIGYELEAQLLTGKQINLSKARELALNNDLAGLATELANNGATAAEFSNMNRIQQEALAKSLGMSRQELAKSIVLQDKSNSLTNEQRASVLGMTTDDLKRMDIQTSINKSIEKMFSLVAPILDTVTTMLSKWYIMYPLIGTIALSYIPTMARGMKSFLTAVGSTVKAIGQLVVGKTAEAAATVTSTAATVTSTAATTANTAAQVANTTARQGLFATIRTGLISAGTALGSFGTAAAPAIPILLTIAAVVASIGVAAAGLGFGLKMAADGFVKIIKNVSVDKIKPLLLLGPALFSIAAGLGAISLAGLTAIPTLAALSGLALVSAPLLELAGMFNNNDNNSNESSGLAKVEAKLDKLISVVSAGGDVILDGNKVGSALVLGSYKSS